MTAAPSPACGTQRWTTVIDGHRLRQLRHQQGLSQEQQARQTGMSLTTITRLERRGRQSCRTRTLARLAAALGQSPATLTSGQSPSGHTAPESAIPPPVLGQHPHELRRQAMLGQGCCQPRGAPPKP